jgi:phosphoglycerol geranylgeranyltransferase
MTVLDKIKKLNRGIAVLIDPDTFGQGNEIDGFLDKVEIAKPDFIFIGGSSVSKVDFEACVEKTKRKLNIPLVLFPGASHHLSKDADAVLFLSLISGRNPDFLIGQHVKAVDELETLKLEVIPTSYLLINGGQMTSVEYVSRTTPIPKDAFSIAKKTAVAGKYLGHQLIYADAGSGALNPINCEMIQSLATVDSPLIIGGGLRSISAIEMAHKNGANLVVIGNRLEEDLDFLLDLKFYKEVQK